MIAASLRNSLGFITVAGSILAYTISNSPTASAQANQPDPPRQSADVWDYGQPPRFDVRIFDEEGPRNPVPELSSLIPATRSSYRTFYDTTMNDPDLSPPQRRARIEAHFQTLRAGIVAQRTASYRRFSHRLHVRHSCTNNGSGTRRCPSADKCRTIDGIGLV